jgi:hypothetical protein
MIDDNLDGVRNRELKKGISNHSLSDGSGGNPSSGYDAG